MYRTVVYKEYVSYVRYVSQWVGPHKMVQERMTQAQIKRGFTKDDDDVVVIVIKDNFNVAS